jgi:hypothetical protein
MPKIRGVKPDLWTDENFVELSPYARLLWIGLWNHACDNGHLQDKSKQIKMRVLPTDDVNCADLLREIADQRLIEQADGWITIPNLSHHQKPHKRWWTTCDKPGCVLPEGTSHAPDNRSNTVAPPKSPRSTTADCDGEGDGELKVTTAGTRKRPTTRLADDWQPTEAHWERRHDGIDVQREAETFKAHAEANDRRAANWNAAFTQWLLKARAARPGSEPQQHKGRAAQWLDLARQLQDEEQAALEIQP